MVMASAGQTARAQFARDAALLPVGIAAQRMQPAKACRGRRLFHRVAQGDLALEKILARQAQALEQLGQQQATEKSLIASISSLSLTHQRQMFQGVCIQIAKTTSHTPVSGMKIFQPKRMIWS